MLIPRFSLRWVLAVIGVCGVAFLVLSFALEDSEWAVMITALLLCLVSAAVCHALAFAFMWLLSLLVGGLSPAAAEHTPFRSETPAGPLPGKQPNDAKVDVVADVVQPGAADGDAPPAPPPDESSGRAASSHPTD